MDEPFLHLRKVNQAIERLAAASTVTIFAGAGVAKDRRSPDWSQLAKSILRNTLSADHDTSIAAHSELLADLFSKHSSPLMLASAIRYLEGRQTSPEDVTASIARILYWDRGPTGHLAQGIAWLAAMLKFLEKDVVVITTNYDTYIEGAKDEFRFDLSDEEWAERLSEIELRACTSRRDKLRPNQIPVYHFHGVVLPGGKTKGASTFCEIDYSAIRGGWQESLLIERLVKGSVLFVGASMSDPYISHCLYKALHAIGQIKPKGTAKARTAEEKEAEAKRELEQSPWMAVLPLQGESWWNEAQDILPSDPGRFNAGGPTNPVSRDALLTVAGARLGYLGVQALFADYYSQVGQFCWEVLNCVIRGPGSYRKSDSPYRYGHRLSEWWRTWDASTRLGTSTEERQDKTWEALFKVKEGIVELLDGKRDDEQFKIELWARIHPDPKGRSLALWATSQAAMRDAAALHEETIHHDSSYIAVQTFAEGRCIGPPTQEDIERVALARVGEPLANASASGMIGAGRATSVCPFGSILDLGLICQ